MTYPYGSSFTKKERRITRPMQKMKEKGAKFCSFVDTVRFPEQSKKYVFLSRKTKKICSFVGTERFPQHLTRGPSSSVAEERMNLPTNG
ncbi:hypothetical protein NPIL_512311 [Nephila pilipes]|uniref:Uncharacterized protein n=1 Tax=Nephila pilipes TaxID=299642 RepID=A0A8X6QPS2_NEPPI|nr:hypothetical protein NPIL_512311 [Nephila pilipes]